MSRLRIFNTRKPGAVVLLLLAAAALLAAVCGDEEIEIALNQAPAGPPEGKEAVLRLQTHTETIKCGETATVEVWLDDLPDGPPVDLVTGEPVSDLPKEEGVAGFDFVLAYDRDVVQIAEASDAVVADTLKDAKPDVGGRVWVAPAPYIRNDEGWLFWGAADAGIDPAGAPDTAIPERLEDRQGVKPTAQGASILLATVDVTAVGAGVSELRLDGPARGGLVTNVYSRTGAGFGVDRWLNAAIRVEGDCIAPGTATPAPAPVTATATPTRSLPITPPSRREPPYPLPTPEPECAWSVHATPPAETLHGATPRYVLKNSCYEGHLYGFDEETGEVITFSFMNDAGPVLCFREAPTRDPRCDVLFELIDTPVP